MTHSWFEGIYIDKCEQRYMVYMVFDIFPDLYSVILFITDCDKLIHLFFIISLKSRNKTLFFYKTH